MLSPENLRERLPGTWQLWATTFPLWLSGRRLHPTFTYTLIPGEPLRLHDEVRYVTRSGRTRSIVGTDRYDPATGGFVWRGKGMLAALRSRWRLVHLDDDRAVAALTFDRSLLTPAGVDVIGRGDRPPAITAEDLGFDPARFAALRWLPPGH